MDPKENEKGTRDFTVWRRRVSAHFRRAIIDKLKIDPSTDSGRFALRFISFLMFVAEPDEETGRIRLCRNVLAHLAGKKCNSNFESGKLLREFSKHVFPLKIHNWNKQKGLCWSIDPPGWPKEIWELRESELKAALKPRADLVYFDTGEKVTRSSKRQDQAAFTAYLEFIREGERHKRHPAKQLFELLNSGGQGIIRKLWKRNRARVLGKIEAMLTDPALTEAQTDWALQRFASIDEYLDRAYKSSGSTDRLYAVGNTPDQLQRELRKEAYAGAVALDIKSAQLSLAATIWNIPELAEFLKSGKSIWTSLLVHMDLPVDARHKDIVKEAIYSTMFCMTQEGISETICYRLLCPPMRMRAKDAIAASRRFLTHPLVKKLLKAREAAKADITNDGYGTDAFGIRHELSKDNPVRKILPRIMQSYELKVMLGALPVFTTEKRLKIVSWMHDGITVWCTDKRETGRIVNRIKNAIERAGAAEGIALTVEVEYLGEDMVPGDQAHDGPIVPHQPVNT